MWIISLQNYIWIRKFDTILQLVTKTFEGDMILVLIDRNAELCIKIAARSRIEERKWVH